jgi:hypothetical protein
MHCKICKRFDSKLSLATIPGAIMFNTSKKQIVLGGAVGDHLSGFGDGKKNS